MKIHPRLAGAIFIFIYYFVGILIYLIFKLNLFQRKAYIGIGLVIALIIHFIFEKGYYQDND